MRQQQSGSCQARPWGQGNVHLGVLCNGVFRAPEWCASDSKSPGTEILSSQLPVQGAGVAASLLSPDDRFGASDFKLLRFLLVKYLNNYLFS